MPVSYTQKKEVGYRVAVCCVYLLCQRLRDYTVYKQQGWNLVRRLLRAQAAGKVAEMHS